MGWNFLPGDVYSSSHRKDVDITHWYRDRHRHRRRHGAQDASEFVTACSGFCYSPSHPRVLCRRRVLVRVLRIWGACVQVFRAFGHQAHATLTALRSYSYALLPILSKGRVRVFVSSCFGSRASLVISCFGASATRSNTAWGPNTPCIRYRVHTRSGTLQSPIERDVPLPRPLALCIGRAALNAHTRGTIDHEP